MTLKKLGLSLAAALALAAGGAYAQISDGVIKIGVMNDQSGTYADLAGPGSVVAARMAVEDFGAAKKGMKVEILVADHQNKPEVGSSIARQWFDVDKVDVIVDVPTSSVALAVNVHSHVCHWVVTSNDWKKPSSPNGGMSRSTPTPIGRDASARARNFTR